VIGLKKFAIYVFDYGAPIGWRLFTRHPERVSAIISQNGNAYEEGLSDGWNPIRKYWLDPTDENRQALRDFLKPESTRWQYEFGVFDPQLIAPESYLLDSALLGRPGNMDIQLDLFLDYQNNIRQYPALHQVLARVQPPLLATWGRNDPFFLPAGAERFKRDVPNAVVKFLDTGHFALETHAIEIGSEIRAFLSQVGR
jgi:pimeloyl-ACP methyl ester carboxylesterase